MVSLWKMKESVAGKALGRHILLDLYNCELESLNNIETIEKILEKSAKEANLTILQKSFHKFNPHGISGFILIAESHLSIHVWPEYRYAAIDIYTCGDKALPEKAMKVLIEELKPKSFSIIKHDRGFI